MKLTLSHDPYGDFIVHMLHNGLTVYMKQMPHHPSISLSVCVHSGSNQDPVGQEGAAHFVEHLVFQNAPLPKARIKSKIAALGGSVTLGRTSPIRTQYGFRIPSDLKVLSDTLHTFGHALLFTSLERHIEEERRIILEEFRRKFPTEISLRIAKEEHAAVYGDWFSATMFTGPIGLLKSINALTPGQLQTFYDTNYTPSNMTVVAVGDFDPAEMLLRLRASPFGMSKHQYRSQAFEPARSVDPLQTRMFNLSLAAAGYPETTKTAGYETVAKLPGTTPPGALRLFESMLDEVLFAEIRERRQWTYHIISNWSVEQPFFEFRIGAQSMNADVVDEVDAVVAECIQKILQQRQQLARAKKTLINKIVMWENTTESICQDAASDILNFGKVITRREAIREVESIGSVDLERIASYLLPEYRWVRIIRP